MSHPSGTREAGHPLRELADQCVMCGLCLPHCPTFALTGLESQSPRGRVTLARALSTQPADASVVEALQTCLQCRACERVCPAGVRYGELIEGARAVLEQQRPHQPGLAEWTSRQPALSAAVLGVLGAGLRALPALTTRLGRSARLAARARRPLQMQARSVAPLVLFVGCAARSFEAAAQTQALAVAKWLGLDLVPLAGQGCCGAMQRHQGQTGPAQKAADRLRALFAAAGTQTVVAMDSACIEGLRRDSAQTTSVVELCRWLLDRRADWQPRLQLRAERVGLYLPCSHRNSVGDVAAVHGLLAAMPGLQYVELSGGYGCCGAAGPHLLAHPQRADALAAPIVQQIKDLQLTRVLTTNVGCAMHLQERLMMRGVNVELSHPVACLSDRLPLSVP